MERINVVLAHLGIIQDGTRRIQCTRSMGEPEIKLQDMVDVIRGGDFQSLKSKKLTCRPEEDDSQDQPEEPDDNQVETDGKSCISSGPYQVQA